MTVVEENSYSKNKNVCEFSPIVNYILRTMVSRRISTLLFLTIQNHKVNFFTYFSKIM